MTPRSLDGRGVAGSGHIVRLLLPAPVLLVAPPPGGALAQPPTAPTVADVAAALRSDPLYNDPGAEAALSSADAEAIRERLRNEDVGRMRVAVLPEAARAQAGGTNRGLLEALRRELGPGTYVVVGGRNL